VSTSPSMSWRSFAIHVIAGLVGITFMCAGIAAIATRKQLPSCPVEEDDARGTVTLLALAPVAVALVLLASTAGIRTRRTLSRGLGDRTTHWQALRVAGGGRSC
jgi:hypothetical protein